MQLSMRGKGNAGSNGGPAGDLLISIEQKPHESFSRDGMNIHFDLYVNFADASLGYQAEVPTLNNPVKIKLPPGTQSGKIFRLKGLGVPSVQSYEKGDQLIHINIWTPKIFLRKKNHVRTHAPITQFPTTSRSGGKRFFDRMKEFFHG